MKSLFFALAILLPAAQAVAQEEYQPSVGEPEEVGTVHLPISWKTEVQPPFKRAVALLHSFASRALLRFQIPTCFCIRSHQARRAGVGSNSGS